MSFPWQWVTGPAIGAAIGYITNDIAVRMMFRPHREMKLFGMRLPFTPGIIPKGKPRLAAAIRDVLSAEILTPDVMQDALLSDAMIAKLESAADAAIAAALREERTPRALLSTLFGEAPVASVERDAKRAVGLFLMEKIMDSGLEKQMAAFAVAEARKKVAGSAAAVLTVFWDDKRSASLEDKLSAALREMLATHAPDLVDGMIDAAVRDAMDKPVGALLEKIGDRAGDARAFLVAQYTAFVRKGLAGALRAVDIGAIVEAKLNALDMAELEGLILRVMKKELRAIVWLGGLLGAVIGVANAVLARVL